MAAYVFVEHCVTGTQLHAVMRNAHMAGFTDHACLLVMLPSQKHGAALPALDYHSLRDSRKQSGVNIKAKAKASASTHASLLCDTICICKVKATMTDRLVECHGPNSTNGKFFHLQCLGLKRMPTNHKTTWRCYIRYRLKVFTHLDAAKPCLCQTVLPRIYRSGTNSSTLSCTNMTEHRSQKDAVTGDKKRQY